MGTVYDRESAEHYDMFKLRGYYEYGEDADAFLDAVRTRMGKMPDRILEIGIGTANFAIAVAERTKRFLSPPSFVGVDNSPGMVERYIKDKKRGYGTRIRIITDRAEKMDLARFNFPAKYDVCVSHGFVMWINNPEDAKNPEDIVYTSYVYRLDENSKLFERVAAHLPPGALFLMNMFGYGGDYREPKKLGLEDGKMYTCEGVRKINDNTIVKHHRISGQNGIIWEDNGWLRSVYKRPVIERELEKQGFLVEGPTEDRKFFVARRK